MAMNPSVITLGSWLGLSLVLTSCGGKASSDAAATDGSSCQGPSFEPAGPTIDVTSIFNYTAGFWAAAEDAGRFAFVSDSYGGGGPWLILFDGQGVKLTETLLAGQDGGLGVTRAHGIASDGTRFGLLSEDWDGATRSLVRFRLLDENGAGVEPPVDLGPPGENGSLGAVLWAGNGWLAVWSRGSPTDSELWLAVLAADGALTRAPNALLGGRELTRPRMARTSSGVTAIAWQTSQGVSWVRLESDGSLGAVSQFAVGPTGALSMAASDREFVVGWSDTSGASGDIVRLGEDGTIRCGPRRAAFAPGAFAASGATMVGVGTRLFGSSASSVEIFNVLEDCTFGPSVTVANKGGADSVNVADGSVLVTWLEGALQSMNVRARVVRPSCFE